MSLVVTAFDEGLDSDAVLCSGTVSLGAKVGLQTGPETVTVPLRATSVPDKPTTPAGTVRMTIESTVVKSRSVIGMLRLSPRCCCFPLATFCMCQLALG